MKQIVLTSLILTILCQSGAAVHAQQTTQEDYTKAVPKLVSGLKSKDVEMRRQATLGFMGLCSALGSNAFASIPPEAAKALPKPDAFVPPLAHALRDSDNTVRIYAAGSLGYLGSEAASVVPTLIEMLHDPDPKVREAAASALKGIGPSATAAVPALTEALKDPNEGVRVVAAMALKKIGPSASAAIPALIEASKHSSPFTREAALTAIGNLGPEAESALPSLYEALMGNGLVVIKDNAAGALGKIGEPAVPALIKALREGDSHVQYLVCNVLESMGPKAYAAIPALSELANDPNSSVRQDAKHALKAIQGRE